MVGINLFQNMVISYGIITEDTPVSIKEREIKQFQLNYHVNHRFYSAISSKFPQSNLSILQLLLDNIPFQNTMDCIKGRCRLAFLI